MNTKSIEFQAREYVYDLKNCASEFGFNTQEDWQFSLVTDLEKAKIEKEYYPTVSANPVQEVLSEFLKLVRSNLLLPANSEESGLNFNSPISKNIRHLIAFNPKMHR